MDKCDFISAPAGAVVKNPPENAGDERDADLTAWSERSP